MTRSHSTPSRDEPARQAAGDAAGAVAPQAADCPPATPADISAALLELLRKVNAEVAARPAPPAGLLSGRAEVAVENYRRIAADLRTPSDPPLQPPLLGGASNPPRPA